MIGDGKQLIAQDVLRGVALPGVANDDEREVARIVNSRRPHDERQGLVPDLIVGKHGAHHCRAPRVGA